MSKTQPADPVTVLFGVNGGTKAVFFRQLATMVHSGLPVGRAVKTASELGLRQVGTSLAQLIEKDFLYVADRYHGGDYSFFDVFEKKNAYYVIRIRNNAVFHELESFPTAQKDQHAGVVWDKKVLLGPKDSPKGPFRLILIRTRDKEFFILTNKWDIPAELIGTIYRYRWEIETLFKWIKCNLQCRHLLAESQQGVTIQVYIAIIASLLLFLALGHRPKKREMELIHMYSIGWASLQELLKGLGLKKRA